MVLKNTPLTWGRLCLLVSLCALQSLSAQEHPVDSPHSDRAWLTIGAGIGNTGGDNTPFSFGLAGGIGLTYQPGVVLFTARTAGMWNPFQGDFLGDVALLAGAGTRGQQSHASLAVGPALADGDLRFETAYVGLVQIITGEVLTEIHASPEAFPDSVLATHT